MAHTDHELSITLAFLTDNRELVAAIKTVRWDVTKWTVTVNIAIAAAIVAANSVGGVHSVPLLVVSFVVGLAGIYLVDYYNRSATRIRGRLRLIVDKIENRGGHELEDDLLGFRPAAPGKDDEYDSGEVDAFVLAILISLFAPLIATAAVAGQVAASAPVTAC